MLKSPRTKGSVGGDKDLGQLSCGVYKAGYVSWMVREMRENGFAGPA